MIPFNVINHNFNAKRFEAYDIMPYLVRKYNENVDTYNKLTKELEEATSEVEIGLYKQSLDFWKVPKTFEEFKEFVKKESLHQFWSRCEYEIVLSPWPYLSSPSERYDKKGEGDINAWKEHWKSYLKTCDKWDVYDQIIMNLDIITEILMRNIVPYVSE